MSNRIVELENVCFSYGEKKVLDRISLTVCKGERIGIVGESGCGKSTLLNILAGLYAPESGRICIAGASNPDEISKAVSIVMQSPMLLPMTIRENITLGHKYPGERIRKVLELASLEQWIETLPDGADTYLGDRANELSGGQAQRIAIARAMCKDSEVILLDEPTSALDKETSVSVLKALKNATAGKTVIHVTHAREQLENYDGVYRLRNGKLTEI